MNISADAASISETKLRQKSARQRASMVLPCRCTRRIISIFPRTSRSAWRKISVMCSKAAARQLPWERSGWLSIAAVSGNSRATRRLPIRLRMCAEFCPLWMMQVIRSTRFVWKRWESAALSAVRKRFVSSLRSMTVCCPVLILGISMPVPAADAILMRIFVHYLTAWRMKLVRSVQRGFTAIFPRLNTPIREKCAI